MTRQRVQPGSSLQSPVLARLRERPKLHRNKNATVAIAYQDAPQDLQGYAFRVGWTNTTDEAQALYRIKVFKRGKTKRLRALTLPFFYRLEEDTFVIWEPEAPGNS